MAKFYVDTVSIDSLSRVIKYLSDYADNAQKIPRNAQGQLMFQFGNNVDSLKDRLRDAKKELRTIRDDLDYLAQGLSAVVAGTKDTDAITWALFSDLPKLVLTGEQLITTDITTQFLDKRNRALDGAYCGLSKGLMESLVDGFKNLTYEDYNTSEMKENLTLLVARMMNEKNTVDVLTDKYEFANYFIDGGTTVVGLLEKCPQVKDIVTAYCKGSEWCGYGADVVELLGENIIHHLSDYSINIEKLENIKKALISIGYDADLVYNAINALIADYTDKFAYSVNSVCNAGVEFAADKLVDAMTLGGFNAVDYFSNLLKNFSGMKDQADHLKNIYLTNSYSDALVRAYEQCAERIHNGNATEEDIQNCKIYYEMAICAKLQEYESILAVSDDPHEREQAQAEINKLKNLL